MNAVWSPPAPSELLSSYLARQAIAHGCSAHKLASLVSPGTQVWTRDVDVCASPNLLANLAKASGRSPEMISELTLTRWAQVTSRGYAATKGIYHWIGSIGVYHRTRRRYGLGFCPACLALGGCFLRQWRLSFWTVCPVHKTLMLDACPRCGLSIQPHRQGINISTCWNCNANLGKAKAVSAEATRAQSVLFKALVEPSDFLEPISFIRCSGKELLWGVDALLSGFRTSRKRGNSSSDQWSRVELRRVRRRHSDMQLVDSLLAGGVDGMVSRAKYEHITQRCFRQAMPNWLHSVVAQFPAGRINRHCSRSYDRRELRAVANAQRQRFNGWREMRASLLFKMIGRSE